MAHGLRASRESHAGNPTTVERMDLPDPAQGRERVRGTLNATPHDRPARRHDVLRVRGRPPRRSPLTARGDRRAVVVFARFHFLSGGDPDDSNVRPCVRVGCAHRSIMLAIKELDWANSEGGPILVIVVLDRCRPGRLDRGRDRRGGIDAWRKRGRPGGNPRKLHLSWLCNVAQRRRAPTRRKQRARTGLKRQCRPRHAKCTTTARKFVTMKTRTHVRAGDGNHMNKSGPAQAVDFHRET